MKKATQKELDAIACRFHNDNPAEEDDNERLKGQRFSQRCGHCLGNYANQIRAERLA